MAVLLVLLYHAGVPGFGGGYVGVDVFFVLSGFLITGLIVRELDETGTVSLVAFYARRARRLLPAAALVIVVTVVASAVFLPPLRVPEIARDGAAAALYASNLRFAFQATDYLQAELDPSPLLHFWSLGVEEQFYLFWPALLLIVARGGRGSRRGGSGRLGRISPLGRIGPRDRLGALGRIAATVVLVGAGSLVLSVVLTSAAEPWAFFSLPSRAWELALGAVLALVATRPVSLGPRLAAAAGALGVAMIVIAGVALDTATPFPGIAALLPTTGAALVIGAGLGGSPARPSRFLGLAPLRWLGRISYSLYLWHWPIIVIPAAALGTDLPLPVRIALALAAIPVAAASQRWVEEPIRRGRLVGLRPRRNLALAGALTLAVAGVSVGLGAGGPLAPTPVLATGPGGGSDPGIARDLARVLGAPGRLPPPGVDGSTGSSARGAPPSDGSPSGSSTPVDGSVAAGGSTPPGSPPPTPPGSPPPTTPGGPVPADLRPSLLAARDDLPRTYGDGCHLSFAETESGTCVYGVASASRVVVLFGDSHAAQWFPALERLALGDGWRLVSLTKSACAAADVTVWNSNLKRAYTECDTWRANALARIAAERPDLVVVSNSQYLLDVGGQPVPEAKAQATWDQALGRTLGQLAKLARQVVLIGATPRPADDPPVCLSAHLSDALACARPMTAAIDAGTLASERAVAGAAGVTMIDPTAWVCPSEPCPVVIGRVLVYRDTHHLTATFSAALAPYLAARLPGLGP